MIRESLNGSPLNVTAGARVLHARGEFFQIHLGVHTLYQALLFGCVSQGLGTTEFTNLIGWNRY